MLDVTLDKQLVAKIVKKMSGNLWYLEEETVAVAFFDSKVLNKVKEEMVLRLRLQSEEHDENEEDDCYVSQYDHSIRDAKVQRFCDSGHDKLF